MRKQKVKFEKTAFMPHIDHMATSDGLQNNRFDSRGTGRMDSSNDRAAVSDSVTYIGVQNFP